METIQERLRRGISDYIKAEIEDFDDQKGLDTTFSKMGLDSMAHVGISTVVEDISGISLDPDVAFNYPTVNALINYVCKEMGEDERASQEIENEST